MFEKLIKDSPDNGMKLKKWLSEHGEIKKYLEEELQQVENLNKVSDLIYCIKHGIDYKNLVCKSCGKKLKINHITQRPEYCSVKCAMNDSDLINHRKETINEDKGYWSRRQEKIRKTCLKRYGVEIASKAESIKQKIKDTINKDPLHWQKCKEKAELTCMKRYGVKNASSTPEVRQKVVKTNLERYGVTNINKLPETLEKIKQTCLKKYRC